MRRRATTRRLRRTLLAGVAALAVGLVVLLELTGALDRAELSTVDARFQVRGARAVPDDVMVVGIDDTTFSELDQRFPFSRRTFARALRDVSDDHPRAIVYDVEFAEQSDDVVGDNRLVLDTRRAGNVILSATEVGKGGRTKIFGGVGAQSTTRDRPGMFAPRRSRAWSAAGSGPGRFRDRIVVIGAVAPSLQDRHPTSWPAGEMAGPEIHANAIDTLLRGLPLHATGDLADLMIAIGLAGLPALLGLRLRPFVALGLGAAAAVLYVVIAQVAFGRGLILPVVVPLCGLAVALVGALLVHWLTASVERAQTRDL